MSSIATEPHNEFPPANGYPVAAWSFHKAEDHQYQFERLLRLRPFMLAPTPTAGMAPSSARRERSKGLRPSTSSVP
jgi:hypothetical protein